MKAILLALALLGGFFDHTLGGWGEPVAMAAASVAVPVLLGQSRKFWNQRQFWITVSLLAVIQVPVVIAVQPWVERRGRASALLFGIVDGLFVIAMIFLVCSNSNDGAT